MKRHKIAIDARMINSSGIGTYLKNVIPFIVDDFKVTLLGDLKELNKFKWAKNCNIISFTSKIYSLEEQFNFPLKVPYSELLWCPHFNTPFFPVKAKNIITTIHDVNHLTKFNNNTGIKRIYAKKLYFNAVNRSEKIITVSKFSKAQLLTYTNCETKHIEVISNGVKKDLKALRNENDIKNLPKNYILFVGNVKPHKNLKTLLKAYIGLSKEDRDNYKLVILGKKEGFITPDNGIQRFIEENHLSDYVHFTGYVSDDIIPIIYKQSTMLVFPSYYEGFGLPLLEAMTYGTAVISSNAASLPEIGGNAALFFDPKNDNELRLKIELFLHDKKLKLKYIERGYERIKQYSWETSAKLHIMLFQDIINSNLNG